MKLNYIQLCGVDGLGVLQHQFVLLLQDWQHLPFLVLPEGTCESMSLLPNRNDGLSIERIKRGNEKISLFRRPNFSGENEKGVL